MSKRAETLAFAGNFETNLKTDFVTVGPECKLRIPTIFDGDSKAWTPSSADENGQPVSLTRLQPTVCTLPGLMTTFEKFVAEGDKTLPLYCYLAASPVAANQSPDDFKASLEAEIAKSGASGGKFSSTTLTGPGGVSQKWDYLSIGSQQRFAGMPPAGQESTVDGRFDLYLYSTSTTNYLIGWRGPSAGAASKAFFDNSKLAMGAAQLTGSAPPAGGPPATP